MKRLLFFIAFSLCAIFAQAQFRLAVNGTPSWSNLGGGLYQATVTFHADLTGNSYAVAGIVDTMRLFTSRGQVFEIDSVWGKTFSQATLRVEYLEGTISAPVGQGMVYDPNNSVFVPDVPFGSTGATAQLNQSVVSYNATKSGRLIDGDYTDIDVTSSGTVMTIDTGAVTWLKLAQAVKDSIAAGLTNLDTLKRLQNYKLRQVDLNDLAANEVPVFILTGQSNAEGGGDDADGTAGEVDENANVKILEAWPGGTGTWQNLNIAANYTNGRDGIQHGAELEWQNIRDTFFPDKTLWIIKHAVGATGIDPSHLPGGAVYDSLWVNYVQAGINSLIDSGYIPVVSFYFMQGETEANAGGAAATNYEANLRKLVAYWQSNISPDMPISIGRVNHGSYTAQATINAAQIAVANDFDMVASFSTNGYPKKDADHFDYDGQKLLARAFYDCLVDTFGVPGVRIYEKLPRGQAGATSIGSGIDSTSILNDTIFANSGANQYYTGLNFRRDRSPEGEAASVDNLGNLFIGYKAGLDNYTSTSGGSQNTFLGTTAGENNDTGRQNTFVGSRAGFANITGIQNTYLGQGAGFRSVGSGNVYAGYHAGKDNIGTGNNTFVGLASGQGGIGSTTNSSTAVGESSLYSVTTGNALTAIGRNSLYSNTSGGNNLGLGQAAGFNNTTGSNNIYLGHESGRTATPANANLTGSNNLYIGYQAGPGNTSQLSNAGAIGYKALVNASNALNIGGYQHVGIDVANPLYKLHVAETDATTGSFIGFYTNFVKNVSATSGPVANNFFESSIAGTGKVANATNLASKYVVTNSNNLNIVRAITSRIEFSGAGDAEFASCLNTHFDNSSTDTIGAWIGLSVGNVDGQKTSHFNNTGVMDSTYAIYVGDITTGTQLKTPYNIYLEDGNAQNYLNGATGINSAPVTGVGLTSNLINATTGFKVNNAATSGNYLRGNGTNFVSSAIQAGDISSIAALLGGNTGPITLGTNNATPFHFEVANSRVMSIPSSGITSSTTASKMLTLDSNDSLKYNTVISSEWDNTVTQSGSDTLLNSASGYGHFQRVGNIVTFTLRIEIALTNTGNANTVYIDPPVASNFTTAASDVIGTATMDPQTLSGANTQRQRCLVFASDSDDKIGVSFDPVASLTYPENRMYISVSGSYIIQ